MASASTIRRRRAALRSLLAQQPPGVDLQLDQINEELLVVRRRSSERSWIKVAQGPWQQEWIDPLLQEGELQGGQRTAMGLVVQRVGG